MTPQLGESHVAAPQEEVGHIDDPSHPINDPPIDPFGDPIENPVDEVGEPDANFDGPLDESPEEDSGGIKYHSTGFINLR